MKMRTLVVDDEPVALEALLIRLEQEMTVEVCGTAADGASAVEAIRQQQPDLVLLDVQMPGLNGFEVLARVAEEHLPLVIFTTAFDAYALKAFEIHAIDYLLKPFDQARLHSALQKALVAHSRSARAERHRLAALVEAYLQEAGVEPAGGYVRRFSVRRKSRFVLLPADRVDWIEAVANYVRLHAGEETFLLRTTLSELASRLDPAEFARVHRSAIVNLNAVTELIQDSHGDGELRLRTGAKVRMSRSYKASIME